MVGTPGCLCNRNPFVKCITSGKQSQALPGSHIVTGEDHSRLITVVGVRAEADRVLGVEHQGDSAPVTRSLSE